MVTRLSAACCPEKTEPSSAHRWLAMCCAQVCFQVCLPFPVGLAGNWQINVIFLIFFFFPSFQIQNEMGLSSVSLVFPDM